MDKLQDRNGHTLTNTAGLVPRIFLCRLFVLHLLDKLKAVELSSKGRMKHIL